MIENAWQSVQPFSLLHIPLAETMPRNRVALQFTNEFKLKTVEALQDASVQGTTKDEPAVGWTKKYNATHFRLKNTEAPSFFSAIVGSLDLQNRVYKYSHLKIRGSVCAASYNVLQLGSKNDL